MTTRSSPDWIPLGAAWPHDAPPTVLQVSMADALAREHLEALARVCRIPKLRWRRHHPLGSDRTQPMLALVDGGPAMNAAAWRRFAALVPGSVALAARTASELGVPAAAPGDRPHRVARAWDLMQARRRRRRLRRRAHRIDADVALLCHALDAAAEAATRAGDDGAALPHLPPYALATRLQLLLRAEHGRDEAAALELLVSSTRAVVARHRAAGSEAAASSCEHELHRLTALVEQIEEQRAQVRRAARMLAVALTPHVAPDASPAAVEDLTIDALIARARGRSIA